MKKQCVRDLMKYNRLSINNFDIDAVTFQLENLIAGIEEIKKIPELKYYTKEL